MAKRHNHYEAAFEDFLRSGLVPYVAVDEQRRALEAGGSLKNLDFLLSVDPRGVAEGAPLRWLVDVKGRRFPSGVKQPQYWRNWTTRDELDSLARWRERFGPGSDATLVFAYHLVGDRSPVPNERVYWFRDRPYGFVAVRLDDYTAHARTLSPRWGTVSVPVAQFRRMARPVEELLFPAVEVVG